MRRGLDTDFLVAAEMQVHAKHSTVRDCYESCLADSDIFVLVPSVLSEFVHVVTDPKRFAEPLPMATALQRAEDWWSSAESEQLHTDELSMDCFFEWHTTHRLGRKRLHDTLLAATLHTARVTSLLTLNPSDFRIFGCFEFHPTLL